MTRLFRSCVFATLSFAAACGDNRASIDAGHIEDGGADAAPTSANPFVVAAAGDFTTGDPGVLSLLNPNNDTVRPNAIAGAVGDDPFLRLLDGKLYVINRDDGDNVTVLDSLSLALGSQMSTGSGSNPQDVAVVGSKLYVPALGTAGVVVLQSGSAAATIDLSALDIDGFPDCVSAYAVGTKVYVACGLLDEATFLPRGPGVVAVIDTTTDTFLSTQTVTLTYANPQNMIVQSPADSKFGGDLLIQTVPSFTDYSAGCLGRVTPGATPAAHGCAIKNSDLAGFTSHVDIAALADGTETLWMAVTSYTPGAGASLNTFGNLRSYDLKAGTLAAAISASTEVISDVATCANGDVIAADTKSGAAGLRVFNGGVEKTTAALSIGLSPGDGNGMVCYNNNK